MANKGMKKHSKKFLMKSIAFHSSEIDRLQQENRQILLGEYEWNVKTSHSVNYAWKKIALNNKKIEKHYEKKDRNEGALRDFYPED